MRPDPPSLEPFNPSSDASFAATAARWTRRWRPSSLKRHILVTPIPIPKCREDRLRVAPLMMQSGIGGKAFTTGYITQDSCFANKCREGGFMPKICICLSIHRLCHDAWEIEGPHIRRAQAQGLRPRSDYLRYNG
ncbi:hypothetical protein GW17_00026028 [Ensete ventricosum]|nr:hypothetical protein GW17_00026028 [Ensete ventricosum]